MVYFYNTTPHACTGHSPFVLLFGRAPALPLDMFVHSSRRDEDIANCPLADSYLTRHLEYLSSLRESVKEKIEGASVLDHPEWVTLKEGDHVLLWAHAHGRNKIQSKYNLVPYRVMSTPTDKPGPFIIARDDGSPKSVTHSEIQKYYQPAPRVIYNRGWCIVAPNGNPPASEKLRPDYQTVYMEEEKPLQV